MNKSSIVIAIYICGLILGAFFLDIWAAETTVKKGLMGAIWTGLFLVGLFYAEQKKD